jgi:hypothetical protein
MYTNTYHNLYGKLSSMGVALNLTVRRRLISVHGKVTNWMFLKSRMSGREGRFEITLNSILVFIEADNKKR